jgi:hypothetical protein
MADAGGINSSSPRARGSAKEKRATRKKEIAAASNLLTSPRMPVRVIIDKERRLSITSAQGIVTDAEFLEAREKLLVNPDFDPDYDRIWDFYRITELQVSEEIAATLTAESPTPEKPICRAVVTSEQSGPMKAILDFIGRTRRAHRRIAAFPDLASAEKWIATARLDLPPT